MFSTDGELPSQIIYLQRYGHKISFNNKSKYDGLRRPYTLANNPLRRYLNFCEGILTSLIDSFFVVIISIKKKKKKKIGPWMLGSPPRSIAALRRPINQTFINILLLSIVGTGIGLIVMLVLLLLAVLDSQAKKADQTKREVL